MSLTTHVSTPLGSDTHGRKRAGIVWIARLSRPQTRLDESGAKGSITVEKLISLADRPVAQGQGKTAVEAVKAMTEQNWSKL
jgi:hypothetical protein